LLANLLGLLFTVIDTAYPKITNGYNYFGSSSISWPVASLVVFFPVFILLMWFLEKEYIVEPEMQNSIIHRGLTYITLFVSGLVIVGDLVTVIYYFIDGQELTTGFLLKVLVLFIISSSLFIYYVSDLSKKLTKNSRIIWRIVALIIVVGSIIWGFAVLGSPRTQRLYKYDEQKISDLQNINSRVMNYYASKGILPKTIDEVLLDEYYSNTFVDPQTQKSYEYEKVSDTTYNLCANFNKASDEKKSNTRMDYSYIKYQFGTTSWNHGEGRYCFKQTVNPEIYSKPIPY